MTTDNLTQFAKVIVDDVTERCQTSDELLIQPDIQAEEEFTGWALAALNDAGVVNNVTQCHLKRSRFRIDAFSLNEDEDFLDLFITSYKPDLPTSTLSKDQLTSLFRQLRTCFIQISENLPAQLNATGSPAAADIMQISSQLKRFIRVRLFVLTNSLVPEKTHFEDESETDRSFEFHIWDLRRLFRLKSSEQSSEVLEIDFMNEFGACIPCIPLFEESGSEYKACLAVFPGTVLYNLYKKYTSQLLERNVRAFLQSTGKINKAIRKTILEQPERFFAYNNGISITADDIKYLPSNEKGGEWRIHSIKNFQIVNGGQTTASIYSAHRKSPENVKKIQVQAKITVVKPELVNEIVPKISQYSNSQNKVNDTDFYANDAFHVAMHKLSTNAWTTTPGRQTKWYYERVRGSYAEEKSLRSKSFELDYPKEQKFDKAELARFVSAWEGYPDQAGLGAQKCFLAFIKRLSANPPATSDVYFKRTVAVIIVAKKIISLVKKQKFGGHENHIANYTLALFAYQLKKHSLRLNLDKVWLDQSLSPSVERILVQLSQFIYDCKSLAPAGANEYEWFKKSTTWATISEKTLPPDIVLSLGDVIIRE